MKRLEICVCLCIHARGLGPWVHACAVGARAWAGSSVRWGALASGMRYAACQKCSGPVCAISLTQVRLFTLSVI